MGGLEDLSDEEIEEMMSELGKNSEIGTLESRAKHARGVGTAITPGELGAGHMAGRVFIPTSGASAIAQGLRGYAAGHMLEKGEGFAGQASAMKGQLAGNFLRTMIKKMRAKKLGTGMGSDEIGADYPDSAPSEYGGSEGSMGFE
jgi:hypothetical protein